MRIDSRWVAAAMLCVPFVLSQTSASARSGAAARRGSMHAAAAAQEGGGTPCDGVVAVIRISEITPGGSVEKFMAAVDLQKAWYKSHGMDDLIFATKMLVREPGSSAFAYSPKMAMSFHYYSTKPVPPHDADWDAFVKAFAATSKIKEGPLTCVPRELAPVGAPGK